MTVPIFLVFVVAFSLTLWLIGSYTVVAKIKEPKHKLIVEEKWYEIHHYHPFLLAEMDIFWPRSRAMADGYRILSYYLFWGNDKEKKMDFMNPVRDKRKKIGQHTIQFMLSDEYTMKTIPKPDDTRITIKQVKKKNVAVLKFTWYVTEKRMKRKIHEFSTMLQHDTYVPVWDYISAEYNPPFSFPFMKRNEIIVEIE